MAPLFHCFLASHFCNAFSFYRRSRKLHTDLILLHFGNPSRLDYNLLFVDTPVLNQHARPLKANPKAAPNCSAVLRTDKTNLLPSRPELVALHSTAPILCVQFHRWALHFPKDVWHNSAWPHASIRPPEILPNWSFPFSLPY